MVLIRGPASKCPGCKRPGCAISEYYVEKNLNCKIIDQCGHPQVLEGVYYPKVPDLATQDQHPPSKKKYTSIGTPYSRYHQKNKEVLDGVFFPMVPSLATPDQPPPTSMLVNLAPTEQQIPYEFKFLKTKAKEVESSSNPSTLANTEITQQTKSF
ncbi:hypothetical protein PtA15_9A519 [Puccinia triticina]|uniref:Uncharacterized protein n=1 Tax=Puccinia triticina TaxID=208348 RepID=A0ABY7D0B2_9BASI|nr:uncharacterized protein PtA15_9A519 [Puccinia triticina]WAQ88392.1 hypothetical protein PtA15_9A519 [Puccinia triticina]